MFCKNCGKQLSDDEQYCPGCGTKRPGDDAGRAARSDADIKNLPDYAKENDLHRSDRAIDSDRKKFSLQDDSNRKKFSLSDSGQKKFSLSDRNRNAGDGIVRISAGREPSAPKEPTGFVNPLKDSGKTVFSDNNAASAANGTLRDQAASQAQNNSAVRTNAPLYAPPAQNALGGRTEAKTAPDAPASETVPPPAPEDPTGFVNPLPESGEEIHWGTDGDRNVTKDGFAGDPGQIESHMGFAIAVTVLSVLCCSCISLVLGIVAIVFASQSERNLKNGNYDQAKKSADVANILCWIAIVLYVLSFFTSLVSGVLQAILEAF